MLCQCLSGLVEEEQSSCPWNRDIRCCVLTLCLHCDVHVSASWAILCPLTLDSETGRNDAVLRVVIVDDHCFKNRHTICNFGSTFQCLTVYKLFELSLYMNPFDLIEHSDYLMLQLNHLPFL